MKKVFKITIDKSKRGGKVYGGGMALVAAESAHVALYIFDSISESAEYYRGDVVFKATEVEGLFYDKDDDIICDNIYVE